MNKILIILIVLFASFKAETCRCVPSKNLKSEFNETEIVISGEVVRKEILEESHLIKIEFVIRQVYKGTGIKEKIVIYTYKSNTACGYLEFEIGKEFIVFIYKDTRDEYNLWTTRCTRTSLYTNSLHSELCELMQ